MGHFESNGLLTCGSVDQDHLQDTYLAVMILGSIFLLVTLTLAHRGVRVRSQERAAAARDAKDLTDDGQEADDNGVESRPLLGVSANTTRMSMNGKPRHRSIFQRISDALRGDSAKNALVFPVYFHVLWFTVLTLILRAIMLRFMSRNSIYYGIFYLGIISGASGFVREGLAMFLATRSVGRDAARRAVFVAAIWGIIQTAMALNFFFNPESNQGGQYLGVSVYYYAYHDAMVFAFHFIALCVMLFRANERIGRGHLLYTGFMSLMFGAYLVGDIGNMYRQSWYGCSALLTEFFFYSLFAFVTYFAVRADSNFWRSAGDDLDGDNAGLYSTNTRKWLMGGKLGGMGNEEDPLSSRMLRSNLEQHTAVLDFTEVQVKKVIGVGGNASVYSGVWKGMDVAVKRMHGESVTKQSIRHWVREVRTNSSVQHPNVMKLYGVCVVLPDIYLIAELATRGSLFDLLQKAGPDLRKLSLLARLQMGRDCAAGLAALHTHTPPLAHIDLKSLNYLVFDNNVVKLADFGESRFVGENGEAAAQNSLRAGAPTWVQTQSVVQSTVNWMAPESFHSLTFSLESDVYSLGCVLYECLSGQAPFQDEKQYRIPALVVDNNVRPELPTFTPADVRELILKMWDRDPRKRPRCDQVRRSLQDIVAGFEQSESILH